MNPNKPIQLGLCCINISLRESKPPIYASRRVNQKTIREQGIEICKAKATANLRDVMSMMDWNEKNGIKVFRLSSDIFPHKANPNVENYSFEFAKPLLKEIGNLATKYKQRITMHPGQYNVIGTPSEDAFHKTHLDLNYQATMLDLIGIGKDAVLVIHGGGLYGDKEATISRWCDNFHRLPKSVRRRLVLENCERNFSIEDCLSISEKLHIPIVFDSHHFTCYQAHHPSARLKEAADYIPAILETWHRRGIKPKFHISEQGKGKRGRHADYIETIPTYLMDIPEKYGVAIDIMVEAKMKEKAIKRLYRKYPQLVCL